MKAALAILCLSLLSDVSVNGAGTAGDAPPTKDVPEERIKHVLRDRLESAKEQSRLARERMTHGVGTPDDILKCAADMAEIEFDMSANHEGKSVALAKKVQVLRDYEGHARNRFEAGQVPNCEIVKAQCLRAAAEIELLRFRRSTKKGIRAGDKELQRLVRERADFAHEAFRLERERMGAGASTLGDVLQAANRVLEAELDSAATTRGKAAARGRHLATAHEIEQDISARVEAGVVSSVWSKQALWWRLTAEIELLRLQPTAATPRHLHQAKMRTLLMARLACARELFRLHGERLDAGVGTRDEVDRSSRWLRDSDLEAAETMAGKEAALTRHVASTRGMHAAAAERFKIGSVPEFSVIAARLTHLGAEIQLLRFQRAAATARKN
jgi:hypothetical protein